MKVSGHKSEASIKNYSTKTSEKKLEKMSNFLHTSVATETVESTTEQLQIENNSVDMVDESTVQDILYRIGNKLMNYWYLCQHKLI